MDVIRRHIRAAEAAFAVALGVAIVLGGTPAAPAAVERSQATPIIVVTKNFPQQYVLGRLYKQALEAKGYQAQDPKETYRLDRADRRLAPQRARNGHPEYTGIMLSVTFKGRACPRRRSARTGRRRRPVRAARADAAPGDAVPGPDGIAELRTTATKPV